MMKKLLALLTSICCIAGSTLPASAAWYGEITYEWTDPFVEDGRIIQGFRSGRFYGILVETDGTMLKDDMVSSLDGYTGLATWGSYKNSIPRGVSCYFVTNEVPEENTYMVSMGADLDEEALMERGRTLMMDQECVKNVYLVYFEWYSDAVTFTLELMVKPKSEDAVLTEDCIPELKEAGFIFNEKNQHYTIESSTGETTTSDEVLALDLPFTNLMREETKDLTYAEQFTWFQNYKNEIAAKHSDWLDQLQIVTFIEESAEAAECTATSIWQDTGDSNSDGTTNAQDASQILMHAALAGAAVEGDFTISETNSDVNADGAVNAKDAACVLIYAAAESAGLDMTWADVLRK